MRKHPAEIFGHPIDDDSPQAQYDCSRHWCPFVDAICEKRSRLIKYPMGVCSVQWGDHIVALSPRRFLQDNTVFADIAHHHFGNQADLLLFHEVSVPGASFVGRFDYVLAHHKPMSNHIDDFVVIEFQTGQTTNTGSLVQALRDFVENGSPLGDTAHPFGLNHADIWKRAFTQVLTKGTVLERWRHKIYWVVQEPVIQNFLDRYQLDLSFDPGHGTVFALYDLVRNDTSINLVHTRTLSTTVDDLFHAFRNNQQIPNKDSFIRKLEAKLKTSGPAQLDLTLKLN